MPSIDDYDPNDDSTQSGFGSDGSSGSSSGGGALFGGASKQHEQAYTPWSRFASANSEVAGREAGKLQQQVGGDINSAMQGLDNANAAYDKGINAQYSGTPGTSGQTADTQRAQGGRGAAQGVGQAFGGSQWSSFGQPAPSAGQAKGMSQPGAATGAPNPRAPAPVAPAAPAAMPQLGQLTQSPKANAAAVDNGPQGPKDLEGSMTPDAWAGLTGKVTNADAEATQLGKESGVQALLSQNSGMPATGFDAALIDGAGGPGFAQTAQKFGNGVLTGQQVNSEQASQDAWAKLGGDVAAGQATQKSAADRAAHAAQDAADQTNTAAANKKIADDAAAADRANNAPLPSFDDMLKDTTHTMDAGASGRRNTTANGVKIASGPLGGVMGQGTIGQGGDAWDAAQQYMTQSGIDPGQQSQYWNDFLASLPEGMRNFVNGMVLGGNPGVEALGDKLAPKNSDADWQWFNQLFNAYVKQHGKPITANGGSGAGQGKNPNSKKHEN